MIEGSNGTHLDDEVLSVSAVLTQLPFCCLKFWCTLLIIWLTLLLYNVDSSVQNIFKVPV